MNEYKNEVIESKNYILGEYSLFKCLLTRNLRYYRYMLMKYYLKFSYTKSRLLKFIYYRRYAKYSNMLNVQIMNDRILKGFKFNHQNIVINKNTIIGVNLKCVGNNCIGDSIHGAPVIGNNVTLGYGASIIGNVKIADNVYIGAGAVVTKDCLIPGAKIVGINKIIDK